MIRILQNIFILTFIFCSLSCDENDTDDKSGTVSFGANYNVVNCLVRVTISIDEKIIGTLEKPCNELIECGIDGNVTQELKVGKHSYKIEIRPKFGIGCTKDITGSVDINANECTKIFTDFFTLKM